MNLSVCERIIVVAKPPNSLQLPRSHPLPPHPFRLSPLSSSFSARRPPSDCARPRPSRRAAPHALFESEPLCIMDAGPELRART
jgi:hypothetical protein